MKEPSLQWPAGHVIKAGVPTVWEYSYEKMKYQPQSLISYFLLSISLLIATVHYKTELNFILFPSLRKLQKRPGISGFYAFVSQEQFFYFNKRK